MTTKRERDQQDPGHPVQHVEADHRSLRDQLDAVAAATTRANLLRAMLPLPKVLQVHFALEEQVDGFYDDLRCRCPSMASDLDSLRDEHGLILGEFEALCRQIKDETDAEPADEEITDATTRKLTRSLERLRRHEHKESVMISDAYYTDEGGRG